jgi:hypothetical protein
VEDLRSEVGCTAHQSNLPFHMLLIGLPRYR